MVPGGVNTPLELPIEIGVDYTESVRVEYTWPRPGWGVANSIEAFVPTLVNFAVATSGWVNRDTTLEEQLPFAAIDHGRSGDWNMGENRLVATSDDYSYELVYNVECAPEVRSELPYEVLSQTMFQKAELPNDHADTRRAFSKALLKRGYVIRGTPEEKGKEIVILDGPDTAENLIKTLK